MHSRPQNTGITLIHDELAIRGFSYFTIRALDLHENFRVPTNHLHWQMCDIRIEFYYIRDGVGLSHHTPNRYNFLKLKDTSHPNLYLKPQNLYHLSLLSSRSSSCMLAARAASICFVVVLIHQAPVADLLVTELVKVETHHLCL